MAVEGKEGLTDSRHKMLKRMPHVFSQVLVLPLPFDAPVEIDETDSAFTFLFEGSDLRIEDTVKAKVLEIFSGCKRVFIEGVQGVDDIEEFGTWRYRLPPSAVADESMAFYGDGLLSVIVPKLPTPICKDHEFGDSENGDVIVGDAVCIASLCPEDVGEENGSARDVESICVF